MESPHPDANAEHTLTLNVRLTGSLLDARRGIVRLHPQVLAAVGLTAWDPVLLTGRRATGALAAVAPAGTPRGTLLCDDLLLGNLGLTDGAPVRIQRAPLREAHRVEITGGREVSALVSPEMLRLALLGKVVTLGDNVSLLPQDAASASSADHAAELADARRRLSTAMGIAWTTTLLTVTGAEPAASGTTPYPPRSAPQRATGPLVVTMNTVVGWRDGGSTAGSEAPRHAAIAPPSTLAGQSGVPGTRSVGVPVGQPVAPTTTGQAPSGPDTWSTEKPPSLEDLPGLEPQAAHLREWLELGFHHTDVLRRLGAAPHLGVLLSGPAGSGKTTLVRAVAASLDVAVVRRWAPGLAAIDPASASADLRSAVREASERSPAVLLIEDIEALVPRDEPPPLATVVTDVLAQALAAQQVAVVCTTARPESVSPLLRQPELLDREVTVPLPDRAGRRALLEVLLRSSPLSSDVLLDEVAGRTPGFVTADLLALRREAALRAALRQREETNPTIAQADLLGALEVIRPTAMTESTVDAPALSLDDVGDMAEVKQALTEAVLWPLQYPDTFTRLGVSPPRGLLLYGPPGCGKTFLVRALAGSGQANMLSVKGAELLTKWVGESERAVRELFRRAREAAPALIFLDEVDALAPVRGQSTDGGVTDRVVAALLTELDGVEELRNVVVVGATNRPDLIDPALLRPGRLERLVYVPPPDAAARAAILTAAARNTPLTPDVDLTALAEELDGYSSADCASLLREAALAAMRRSLDAGEVSRADVAAAREVTRPSLRPEQVAHLAAYAERQRRHPSADQNQTTG